MTKKSKTATKFATESTPELPKLPSIDPKHRADKLLSICVELLEVCIEVTGTIDPAAAWLVAHAKDELTPGVQGVRRDRPD